MAPVISVKWIYSIMNEYFRMTCGILIFLNSAVINCFRENVDARHAIPPVRSIVNFHDAIAYVFVIPVFSKTKCTIKKVPIKHDDDLGKDRW